MENAQNILDKTWGGENEIISLLKKSDFIFLVLYKCEAKSEFIIHTVNQEDGGLYWGHYFENLSAARKKFDEMAAGA